MTKYISLLVIMFSSGTSSKTGSYTPKVLAFTPGPICLRGWSGWDMSMDNPMWEREASSMSREASSWVHLEWRALKALGSEPKVLGGAVEELEEVKSASRS